MSAFTVCTAGCSYGFCYILPCRHSSGACDCAEVEVLCEHCRGTGAEPCEWNMCGEPAVGITPDAEYFCARHLARDFDERVAMLRRSA